MQKVPLSWSVSFVLSTGLITDMNKTKDTLCLVKLTRIIFTGFKDTKVPGLLSTFFTYLLRSQELPFLFCKSASVPCMNITSTSFELHLSFLQMANLSQVESPSIWIYYFIRLGGEVFIFILDFRIQGNKFSPCKIKQAGAELC